MFSNNKCFSVENFILTILIHFDVDHQPNSNEILRQVLISKNKSLANFVIFTKNNSLTFGNSPHCPYCNICTLKNTRGLSKHIGRMHPSNK